MDPVRNPYNPGAGVRPPALVGRDEELELFDIAIQRATLGKPATSLMLTGLRGTGKTVLLREMALIASAQGWVHQHIEAEQDLAFVAEMELLVRKALLRLSATERLADRSRRAFAVLKSFQLRWKLSDGSDVTVGVDPLAGYADSGALGSDLAALFSEAAELARDCDSGVVFTIDEIQYLSKDNLAALIVGLHQISQEQLPLIVVAAGLPSVPALAGQAKSYAERLFAFREIDSLDGTASRAALETPAHEEGVEWQPAALSSLVDATSGYPYFLQQFAKHAWDIAEGPHSIDEADVSAAMRLATLELDTGFFRVRVERSSKTERTYLCAMASLGPGPYTSAEVAAAMMRTSAQTAMVREALISRGVCYSPRRGELAFTVPMFDGFIRRRFDIDRELAAEDTAPHSAPPQGEP